MNGAVAWFGAWIIAIVLLIALASTSWGKTIVYYMLWLAVLLLLVTHSDELQSLLAPITQGGTQTSGTSATGSTGQTATTASTNVVTTSL